MRSPICLTIPFIALGSLASAQDATSNPDVLFILDGSGSMWGRVNDVEKIVVAKDVMTGLIDGLPVEVDAGLITYGHRERGSCSDIEVIATPGQTARADLLSSLSGITPLGKTPISDSLLQAGQVLRQTEDPVSIVLVSDGIESCEGDPCATAALLREQDIDVRIHVVGFDVDAEAKAQLSCIAEAGGGEYYDASSADALDEALADVRVSIVEEPVVVAEPEPVVAEPEPVVADPNIRLAEDVIEGVDVVDTTTEEVVYTLNSATAETELPAGEYRLVFRNFVSPPLTLEEEVTHVVSAADYGLATVTVADDVRSRVDILLGKSDDSLTWVSPSYTTTQIPSGDYSFAFQNFTSPAVTISPGEDYLLSASNFALATILFADDVLGRVNVINADTDEQVTFVSRSSSEKQIPPGNYRLVFNNFVSPVVRIAPGADFTVSASDYGLATIQRANDVLGQVDVVDADTGEKVTFVSRSSSEKQVPPGNYRFLFPTFTSPEITIEPSVDRDISAAEFGLAIVQLGARIRNDFFLLQGNQDPINLKNGRERQIAPGPYAQVYQGAELGIINLAPGETRIIEIE